MFGIGEWFVENDWSTGNINIWCVDKQYGRILRFNSTEHDPPSWTWVDQVEQGEILDPTLRLHHRDAQGLYRALGEKLNLPAVINDAQREDYLHERGRVDLLIEALIGDD